MYREVLESSGSQSDALDRLLRSGPQRRRWDSVPPAAKVGVLAVCLVIAVVVWLAVGGPSKSAPANIAISRAGSTPSGVTIAVADQPAGSSAPATIATSTSIASELVVHVAGAVQRPGVVKLAPDSRVAAAIEAAGGPRVDADFDRINLAAPVTDGSRIYLPIVGAETPPEVVPTPAPSSGSTSGIQGGGGSTSAAATPVNINTATADQLDTLPGVGPSTASAIVSYRDEHGTFHSIDELQEVRGIGPAKFEALRKLVVAS